MIKFKYKNKKDKELLLVKLNSKSKVNAGEVERLSSGKLEGFLQLVCEGRKSSKTIIYDVSNFVTLKKFLAKPHTKESFVKVLQQVAKVMRNCEEYGMSSEKLILDCDYVFVDYMTDQLLFIYYPLESYEPEEFAVTFMQQIACNTNASKNCNIDFLIDFRKYADSLKYFALVDFERKIEALSTGISEDDKIKPHKSHYYSGDMIFNPFADKPKSNNNYAVNLNKCFCPKCNSEYSSGTRFCSECGENLTPIKGNTETVETDNDKKRKRQTRVMIKEEDINYPSLLRMSDNNEIIINKIEFSIGYNDDCDYSFQDNDLISGYHASIILSEEKVYIVDNHSTNGTYINDVEIPYGKKVLINSGDKITLADEDFILRGND